MKTNWMVLAFAVAHLLLAIFYAAETPYRTAGFVQRQPAKDIGAPDERQHANYVQHLLDGNGFPVFSPGAPDLYETYQSHQPPLFYLAEAGWVKLTGGGSVEDAGVGARMRWLNAAIGASTVVGTFFLALWAFERRDVALIAAGTVALLPMMAALSGAVSNDPLLYALCTWTMAVCALSVRQGWTARRALVIGLLCGAAFLTKTTALALVPAVAVAALVSDKRAWRLCFGALVLAVALAAPWWARNQQLYGDPWAIKAFNQAFVGSPKTSDMIAATGGAVDYWANWFLWTTVRSFYGVFGYMDIFLNETGRMIMPPATPSTLYRVLLALSALLSVGWIASWRIPEWRKTARVQLVFGVFALVVVALFLRFNLTYFQAQARYLYPAIACIAVGFGIGLTTLAKERTGVVAGVLAVLLIGVNVFALSRLPAEFEARELGTPPATSLSR